MQFKSLPLLLVVGLATACSNDDDIIIPPVDEPAVVAGVTALGHPGVFPHDKYTVEDNTTFTNRRVNYTQELNPGLANQRPLTRKVAEQINLLDGFGTAAGGWVQFSGRINRESIVASQNTFIGYLDGDTPVFVPHEASVLATQVTLRPHVALPPNSEGFLFTTTGITDRDGGAIGQDPELKRVLSSQDEDPVNTRIRALANKLVEDQIIASTNDLTALSVFTTQSIHEQTFEIAERIQTENIVATATEPCEVQQYYRFCKFEFTVTDFVGDDQTIDADAIDSTATYTLKAVAYLPLESDAPYEIAYDPAVGFPVSIFGHGLTGDKTQANLIAKYSAPLGIATVSIDAPQHGEHPLAKEHSAELDIIIALFGIVTEGDINLNTRVLRDGWRHSNLDKLGLVEALKNGIELDGNTNTVEFDASRLSYLGASLGAIQGSEFLALSTDVSAALLAVGGARISDIVRFGTIFKALIKLLLNGTEEEDERFYVLLQTAVESGDGANWAPYVMQNRLRGEIIPDIAMQSSIPDEIVPPETALVLARSLGVTLIGDAPLADSMIPQVEGQLTANHPSGRTAGYIQTDWMWRADRGEYVPSTHDKSPDSAEGIAFWLNTYRTLLTDGIMTLENPYPVTGAPAKPTR